MNKEQSGGTQWKGELGRPVGDSRLFKIPLILHKRVKEVHRRVIWFFLAGFISGAVGMIMFAKWWIRAHAKRVTPEEAIKDLEEMKKEDEAHE